MIAIEIRNLTVFKDDGRYARHLMNREVRAMLLAIGGHLQREIPRHYREYRGDLRRSIQVKTEGYGPRMRGLVYSDAPHARTVEEGRAPGMEPPPYQPIADWVMAKIAPPAADLERITNLIRESISAEGIPAQFPFKKALKASDTDIRKLVSECGAGIARRWNEGA